MATAAVTLPKQRRRPLNPLAAGRASFPEIYFTKYIDNSRLVREVGLEKCREYFSLMGVGFLGFLAVLLIYLPHLQCVRGGYEMQELKIKRGELQESNRQLQMEEAALADPQRIDTLARKLGMVSPNPQQVIHWRGADAPSAPQAESAQLASDSASLGDGVPGGP